jgi:hypothetical protein
MNQWEWDKMKKDPVALKKAALSTREKYQNL